jgi:hypothetical protein
VSVQSHVLEKASRFRSFWEWHLDPTSPKEQRVFRANHITPMKLRWQRWLRGRKRGRYKNGRGIIIDSGRTELVTNCLTGIIETAI